LQFVEFFEKRWKVHDDPVPDQSDAVWVHQTYGGTEDVKSVKE